jgi:hypothetical protein
MTDRKQITDLYIATARDSGYQMDYIECAKFVARLLNISPREIWIAFSDLSTMERCAKGEHPACKK